MIRELVSQLEGRLDRSIITTGVGQHQMWTAQFYEWQYPRTLITSGSLGTMGFGLPSAIGAKVARPEAIVIDIDGDASFCMTMEELLSASQANIDVKVIIFNNEEQGMVTEWQRKNSSSRYAHSQQSNPTFKPLAETMGVQAEVCESSEELPSKIRWLLDSNSASLLDVRIASKLNSFRILHLCDASRIQVKQCARSAHVV